MIPDSQLVTIKRQITKDLNGLEMSKCYQVALFRPFLPQQNHRETGRTFTFDRKERL